MNILKKIEYSSRELEFNLYREGLFYSCYNEDAMVFSKYVRAYKVTSRYVSKAKMLLLHLR